MNDMQGLAPGEEPRGSFRFTGNWDEFLTIAFVNLLLTIVTLGIYRFWAKARERRYLWSHTHFIDDSFEWTGTGKEMFVGFLIVMAVMLPALFLINIVGQALILRGEVYAAGALFLAIYAGIFYLYHVATFRALRYKLSRTYWHGIRGGSDDGGWSYGWSGVWKIVAGMLTLGLLIPWAMVQLWNERWSRMSFGPHPFSAAADTDGLIGRWLLIYAAPFIGAILLVALGLAGTAVGAAGGETGAAVGAAIAILIGVILFYLVFLIASLSYYALFYRKMAAGTSITALEFEFTARTKDWLKLILGNIGIIVVTLGFGLLVIPYRNWSFIVRHMEVHGHIDLAELTQSETRGPADAEGIADAFDFGSV